jgi:hypothetical protein
MDVERAYLTLNYTSWMMTDALFEVKTMYLRNLSYAHTLTERHRELEGGAKFV